VLLLGVAAPLILESQRVPSAGFSHQYLKIAAVLDSLFNVLGQFVWNVNRKPPLPAASI
jgi:hypothetical protein